jgi:hypothetical protein
MGVFTDFAWNKGERNRQLTVYRPCDCGTCSAVRQGIGYLSFSDSHGRGFTVWLENEEVFQRLRRALGQLRRANRKLRRGHSVR